MDATPPIHLHLPGRLDERAVRLALRAALTAAHLLGLATGTHLRKLRSTPDPLLLLQARLEEAELRARLALQANEILLARFARIPERRRPHYSPAHRFAILEIKNLLAWSASHTARAFLLCPNTILNWESAANPDSQTVGSNVKPTPPVRRAADVVRSVVSAMTRLGFGGKDHVARVLATAGWKVSARSVGRYRKQRRPGPDDPAPPGPQKRTNPVVTRFVHHVWMMDVSVVKRFLAPDLHLAAVFDAHSRVPLALRLSERKPSARAMARLLRHSARAFPAPRYVITDLGGEFIGRHFRRAVARIGAVHRTASADSILATARLERWWRTLKETAGLYRLALPLTVEDLENRLELALLHYVAFRPHAGLAGATPLEVFAGAEPVHRTAVEAPRGRPGEITPNAHFQCVFLDPANRRFPVLKLAA